MPDGGAFQSLISLQSNISLNTFKKGNWRLKVAESKYIARIHCHLLQIKNKERLKKGIFGAIFRPPF